MTWLFPEIKINSEQETLTYVKKLYATEFKFPTSLLLHNWPDRLILEVRIFGFGFRKVFLYEN
jgi:hypothetical protein